MESIWYWSERGGGQHPLRHAVARKDYGLYECDLLHNSERIPPLWHR